MKQVLSATSGFSLVEVLLAVTILGMIAGGLTGGLLYGQAEQRLAGERTRAVFLAEEGLEAARSIRDGDYTSLAAGTHGATISKGQWELTGTSDKTDIFTRRITVNDIDENRKQVTSTVIWQQNLQRQGEVQLTTYLANWSDGQGNDGAGPPASSASCETYCQSQDYATGVCRQNANQCRRNGETYEAGGDEECAGQLPSDTCCCGL